MLSDFRTKFPRVPGDVAALERCYDELTKRAKDIGMRRPALTSAIGLASGWTGKARDAFDTSCQQEYNELTIWESGTEEAAASLSRYTKVLEAELRIINEVRAQASELWAKYCALPDDAREAEDADYASAVAFLTFLYDKARDGIEEQAAVTAAELRAALYFTPEDIEKHSDGTETDLGDTRTLTKEEIDAIVASLSDSENSFIELQQGRIGDCHLLASLEAYDRTPEGRAYLASLITEHKDANGVVDGFLVRFPGLNDGEPILVKEVLARGNKHKGGGIDVAAVFEMAFVKAHSGGTKSAFPHGGVSGRFATNTMEKISGQPSSFHHDFFWGKKDAEQAAIDAVRSGKPVVAEALPDWATPNNEITVTIDGQSTTIKLADQHVYTVVGADENGVTLANPWGENSTPSGPAAGAVFTMSWKDFHAQFGDVSVGATPWKK